MSRTLFADPYVLAGAALLVGALACAALADRMGVPGLLFFLGLGMLVGDDGLNLISLSEPRVVQAAGVVALLVILFEGGLSTKPTDLRRGILGFHAGLATLAEIGLFLLLGLLGLPQRAARSGPCPPWPPPPCWCCWPAPWRCSPPWPRPATRPGSCCW